MRVLQEKFVIESLAFVIMPDHLHWLFVLGERHDLSHTMRVLKARTAKKFGHRIWQSGFYDRALRSEDDLRGFIHYIVANPLRASLVKRIGDYPLWDAVWLKEGIHRIHQPDKQHKPIPRAATMPKE